MLAGEVPLAPWRPKTAEPLGDSQARAAQLLAVGGSFVPGLLLSLHTSTPRQGQGFLKKYGLQCGEGQDPGSTPDPLGQGDDCSQSLKHRQEATTLRRWARVPTTRRPPGWMSH